MTEKEYRAHPAISRSELWKLNESPEKFKWYKDHPEKPTPALLFGQVVHKLLLEPNGFNDEFAVAPEVDKRTKAGREEYSAFLTANDGKGIVTADVFQTALEMAEKARSEPFVRKLLNGEHEKPFFWTDEVTGEALKCRTDNIGQLSDYPFVMDYKSCNDASNDGFMRDALRWGYDFQAAMYLDGVCKNLFGKSILEMLDSGKSPPFVFVAQEKTPPYSINIFNADKEFIRHGYDTFRELISIYHECKTTGVYWGYLGKLNIVNELQLPAWMAKND